MKRKERDPVTELKNDYARWYGLFENGGSDPFWSDGANLFLVRNHIIYDKAKIEEEMQPDDYPEEYFRELPPEVDKDYMAKADEIWKTAEETYEEATASDDYSWISQNMNNTKYSKTVRLRARNEIMFICGLGTAIKAGDLVSMRRAMGLSYRMDRLKEIRKEFNAEIREQKEKELPLGQLSIFDFM